MIIEKNHRRPKLLGYGVPLPFLDAIDNSERNEDLKYLLRFPESAYFHLPLIKEYKILQGYEVTPIFEGVNGDTFWALLTKVGNCRFVHFELEQDEIYFDYGDNFMVLFADFIVTLYENAEEKTIEEIAQLTDKMGFNRSLELLQALEEADRKGLRKTFESDEHWRKSNLQHFATAK